MNYKTKTVVAGILGLAMAVSMVAVAGGALVASASFDSNLTIGSTGADVTALQTWLIANGFSIPAGATGYFGSQTQSAVAAYQTSVGITPAAGYVGPITRAKLNEGGSVSGNFPAGCTSASGYSSVTGQPCAPIGFPAGCTSAAGFSSTTGMPCTGASGFPAGCTSASGFSTTTGQSCSGGSNGGGSGSLSGGAGDVTITKASDVESEVKEGDSNTKIADFKVKAEGSDVSVSSVKVTLVNDDTNSSSRLNRYADQVTIWEGSKKVGSADVSDFTKTGTSYSKSISLSGATVNENAKVDFFVAVTAIDHIDGADATNDWNVTVTQVRFEDSTGAILTADVPSSLTDTGENFMFQSLANSGDVKMHISTVGPTTQDVTVSDTGPTSDVPLLYITLRAEGSDMTFSELPITVNTTGVTKDNMMISNFRLVEGKNDASGNEIDSQVASSTGTDGGVTFTSTDDVTIADGSTKTYTVFGKVKQIGDTSASSTSFDQGDSISVSMNVGGTNFEDKNGDAADTSGSASGDTQTLKSQGISVVTRSKVTPTYQDYGTSGTTDDTGTFVIPLAITANDETVYVPLNTERVTDNVFSGSNFGLTYNVYDVSNGGATTTGAVSASFQQSGNQTGVQLKAAGCSSVDCLEISAGATANVDLQVIYDPTVSSQYRVQVGSVNFVADSAGAADTANVVLPVENFRTDPLYVKN
ncbi:MAG: peptidoglycan-binding protein [Candidatus Pacebacteria bacterium]|nr:peptidoglycan-binding protein [Candidatus Paceibacterota bacterium]